MTTLAVGVHMLLPPGRIQATLADVRDIWGFNGHRLELLDEFERFVTLVTKAVKVEAYWISGTILSDKPDPSDVDVVFLIDEDTLAGLGTAASRLATPKGLHELASRRQLRVDAYVLPWRLRTTPESTSEDDAYLRQRGYWDDFWMRLRSVPKGDTPVRLCALPRRGYVEVIVNGYK